MIERARKRLSKRAKKGFRGWPVATVALYGPDDTTATKLTVGIVPVKARICWKREAGMTWPAA